MVCSVQADKKKELMPKYIKHTLECAKELNIDTGKEERNLSSRPMDSKET